MVLVTNLNSRNIKFLETMFPKRKKNFLYLIRSSKEDEKKSVWECKAATSTHLLLIEEVELFWPQYNICRI